jgi:hypothetical protein
VDQPIRIPRNLTALMQHLQRLVTSGHYFWTGDRIPVQKLPGLIAKWQPDFHLRADAAARAYRKRTGRASVHLCVHPHYLTPEVGDMASVLWWMLSSVGTAGLATGVRLPGKVADSRTLAGRLRCGDYELLEQPKSFRDGRGKVKTVTTWTWRIAPNRYREWEAWLVERAKARDREGITKIFDGLRAMPMFAGVRVQVDRLAAETNKVLVKMKQEPMALPDLPVMRMISLWDDHAEL